MRKKECNKSVNHSHIAGLQFAYCKVVNRILFLFSRNLFCPHSEGAVEGILFNAMLV